jgi:hypothetical protein
MTENRRTDRPGGEANEIGAEGGERRMLYSKKWSWLKAWAMQIARRRGMKKAIVAPFGRS